MPPDKESSKNLVVVSQIEISGHHSGKARKNDGVEGS
jgi:hypothetical protein